MKTKLFTLIATFLILFSNSCKTSNGMSSSFFSQKEFKSDIHINDSISDIITKATNIKCKLVSSNPLDTVRKNDTKSVPAHLRPVLSFLISDPSNFETNDIVYGLFSPSVRYEFEKTKNQKVMVDLDFGLKKLKISDRQGNIILISDMPTTSNQFLRLTRLIFPKDVSLKLRSENQ